MFFFLLIIVWLQFYNFQSFNFLHLVIAFCVSLAPIIVMVPGDCCFYVYCVIHFHRKKLLEVDLLLVKVALLLEVELLFDLELLLEVESLLKVE